MILQLFIQVSTIPTLRGFICNSEFENKKITKEQNNWQIFRRNLIFEMITVRNDTKRLSGHQNDVKHV